MKYYFIKPYHLNELKDPLIYKEDKVLRALCRQVLAKELCEEKSFASLEASQKYLLSGGGADRVLKAVDTLHIETLTLLIKYKELKEKLKPSYAIGLEKKPTGCRVLVRPITFDSDLNDRIKRIRGWWDGRSKENRCLWVIPLDKVGSIGRVIVNHQREMETNHTSNYRESKNNFKRQRQPSALRPKNAGNSAPSDSKPVMGSLF